jgi:CheY-like chemotaxis protein
MRKCLIVEDDDFKLTSVRMFLTDLLGTSTSFSTCEALSTAIELLSDQEFDLVIVDMSIPSHPVKAGEGSPFSFPSGGLDVLFQMDAEGHQSTCIVLTQYPEIEIDGVLVPVDAAAEEIERKFEIKVAGCVQYFEDKFDWKEAVKQILNRT